MEKDPRQADDAADDLLDEDEVAEPEVTPGIVRPAPGGTTPPGA